MDDVDRSNDFRYLAARNSIACPDRIEKLCFEVCCNRKRTRHKIHVFFFYLKVLFKVRHQVPFVSSGPKEYQSYILVSLYFLHDLHKGQN